MKWYKDQWSIVPSCNPFESNTGSVAAVNPHCLLAKTCWTKSYVYCLHPHLQRKCHPKFRKLFRRMFISSIPDFLLISPVSCGTPHWKTAHLHIYWWVVNLHLFLTYCFDKNINSIQFPKYWHIMTYDMTIYDIYYDILWHIMTYYDILWHIITIIL